MLWYKLTKKKFLCHTEGWKFLRIIDCKLQSFFFFWHVFAIRQKTHRETKQIFSKWCHTKKAPYLIIINEYKIDKEMEWNEISLGRKSEQKRFQLKTKWKIIQRDFILMGHLNDSHILLRGFFFFKTIVLQFKSCLVMKFHF